MKKLLLILALAAFALPVLAQTITNVTVSVVTPPTPIVHKIAVPAGELDPAQPDGKRGFVTGVINADGTATMTIIYR